MRPTIQGQNSLTEHVEPLLVDFNDAGPRSPGVPDHWTLEALHKPNLFRVKFVAPVPAGPGGFSPDRMRPLPQFTSKWELLSSPAKLLTCWKIVWQEVRAADVVLANVPGGAAIMACLAARLLRKPHVVIVHGDLRARLPLYFRGRVGTAVRPILGRIYTLFERALISGTPTLVVSYELAERYRRVRSVKLGAYSSIPSREIGVRPSNRRPGPIRLLFVGSFEPNKGVDVLLRALPDLEELDYELRICGKGAMEPLCAAAASRYSNVLLLGHVEHEQVLTLCEDSDIVVVPARPGDGIPRIILEAWAKGCAVVASDTAPIRMLCGDDGAVLVPANSPAELAAAIIRAAANPSLRDGLVKSGYERVRPMTVEATMETLSYLLQTAMGRTRTGR